MVSAKLIILALGTAATIAGTTWNSSKHPTNDALSGDHVQSTSVFSHSKFTGSGSVQMADFEMAATKAAPAVVHIKAIIGGRETNEGASANGLQQYFDDGSGQEQPERSRAQMASGSGVSVSADGYIVTNNHVVEHASELMVTLNNKKDYKATIVGVDPSSDLAVIKIDAEDLPYLSFANSDDVHLGQWVLAIGYPLNLETTVTSGIVSAKARNIGINNKNSKSPVESFIQTDAAVNPGNSGGALVNTLGEIIGINSAIASPTGSYAGYSYAIPSNLVKKVVTDIIKYGSSKRAYLGVSYGSDQMSEADRKNNNIKEGDGVFVMDVSPGSAAAEAGIEKGDFITSVNSHVINTGTEMLEKISSLRPGDKISITFQHNGEVKTAEVTLKGNDADYAAAQEAPAFENQRDEEQDEQQ